MCLCFPAKYLKKFFFVKMTSILCYITKFVEPEKKYAQSSASMNPQTFNKTSVPGDAADRP